jgi:hypothetical protein
MSAEPVDENTFAIVFEGETVDLGHLDEFVMAVETQARPKGVTVRVRFSNHCYSERFDEALHADRPIVMDHKNKRAFCPIRHAMSKQLPDLVRGLPESHVYMTPEANYVKIALAEGVEYRVYFNLRRAGGGIDLNLFVESAYAPDDDALAAAKMQKVRFKVLVDTVLSGKKLKFNHRR